MTDRHEVEGTLNHDEPLARQCCDLEQVTEALKLNRVVHTSRGSVCGRVSPSGCSLAVE